MFINFATVNAFEVSGLNSESLMARKTLKNCGDLKKMCFAFTLSVIRNSYYVCKKKEKATPHSGLDPVSFNLQSFYFTVMLP